MREGSGPAIPTWSGALDWEGHQTGCNPARASMAAQRLRDGEMSMCLDMEQTPDLPAVTLLLVTCPERRPWEPCLLPSPDMDDDTDFLGAP